MKNIQVIDGAVNCVYDVYSVTDDQYNLIFISGTDVAFIDEVYGKGDEVKLNQAFEEIWKRRLDKKKIIGIHGTLFYGLDKKKIYYPGRVDDEATNPDGSRLR